MNPSTREHRVTDIATLDCRQGGQAFAQPDNGRSRAALDEFEAVLKIATDNLIEAIADAKPLADVIECWPDPDDEDRVRIDCGDFRELRRDLRFLDAAINRASGDHAWEVECAVRKLRRATAP
jgi:hypothetical protein